MSKPTLEQLTNAAIVHRPGADASNGKRLKLPVPKSGIISQCFEDIQAVPIDWLWPNLIARGKLTIIAGNPGLGKSQITASIAAIVSAEGKWPVSGIQSRKGHCLFLSAEDDPADTLKPRLIAAGADLLCTHVIEAVSMGMNGSGKEGKRAFCFTKDMERLDQEIACRGNVAVVFIDPITAYLGATDSHKNSDIRGLLAPLAEIASRHNIAAIAITHLNKSNGGRAIMKVTGSLGFVAAARAAFLVVEDPEKKARLLFLPIKNNLGPDNFGLAFRIEGTTLPSSNGPIETSRVVWEDEAVIQSADEILSASSEKPTNRRDSAGQFLEEELSSGPKNAKELMEAANQHGHAWKTIQRASFVLKIHKVKLAMDKGWTWELPSKVAKSSEDSHI